jgi:hypothetical protein
MTLTSAVNPNAVNFTQPENAEEWEFYEDEDEWEEWDEDEGETRPYNPSQGRRAVVIVMGVIAALIILSLVAMAFTQGSWWYYYPGDQPLDRESLTRLEAVRDRIDAHGAVPKVVSWLNAALDPSTDPTTVRNHLLMAQEALNATGDPTLVEAAGELRVIMQAIRPASPVETITPSPLPTLEGFNDQ